MKFFDLEINVVGEEIVLTQADGIEVPAVICLSADQMEYVCKALASAAAEILKNRVHGDFEEGRT